MKITIYNLLRRLMYLFSYLYENVVAEKVDGFILCYHSISNDNWEFSLSLKRLEEQLKYLMKNYIPISIYDLDSYMLGTKKFAKPFFLITFDDGYKNIYQTRELFKKLNIKPIVFLLSDNINPNRTELNNNYEFLSLKEIQELKQDGWVFGSHGDKHINFMNATSEELRDEIFLSKEKLEKALAQSISYFAYPKGRYNQEIKGFVEQAGYKLAFSMDSKLLKHTSDKLALPRVGVMNTHSFGEFKSLPLSTATKLRGIILTKLKREK